MRDAAPKSLKWAESERWGDPPSDRSYRCFHRLPPAAKPLEELVAEGLRIMIGQQVRTQRAKELAGQGHLVRLWRLPGNSRPLGLWRARDPAEMPRI